jgi:hypothetical protein
VSIGGGGCRNGDRFSGQHLVEEPRAAQIDSDVKAQESRHQVTGLGERDSPEGEAGQAIWIGTRS